jgi:hypothetical protein
MKKLFLFAAVIILSLSVFAQNKLPGPVIIHKAGKTILLDVTDSTMIKLNDRVKICQIQDTLFFLTRTNLVIAKFAPDTVWFVTGAGYGGSGSGIVTINLNQIAYGTGTDVVGGDVDFLFKGDSTITIRIEKSSDYVGIISDMQDNSSKNYVELISHDNTNNKTATLAVQSFNTYSDIHAIADFIRIQSSDSVWLEGKTVLKNDLFFSKWGTLPDTMSIIMLPNGKVDTITVYFPAAQGWDFTVDPFYKWFRKSRELKALPFKNPSGKEIRGIKQTEFPFFQIENEFEEFAILMKRNWDSDLIRSVVILALAVFLFYQQIQIKKLRKK